MVTTPRAWTHAPQVRVDAEGITARSGRELVLDVLFDGRRIWSLWLHRDGEARGHETVVAWPKGLRRFLDGRARVSVVVHSTGEVLYDQEHTFGTSTARIEVVDRDGNPLATDKTGKLVKTFANRSSEHVAPLLDATAEVLEALGKAGVEPFLAYGTLLGAVREGRLLGHDSDADLGYVSRHTTPVDVMRESFRLQAQPRGDGLRDPALLRGGVQGEGGRGGRLDPGPRRVRRLPARRDALPDGRDPDPVPRGVGLPPRHRRSSRTGPSRCPADPARLLAATYGSGWRTPDPAFHFETPSSTHRRLNGWFRGIRVDRPLWDRVYRVRPVPDSWEPSALARDAFAAHGTEASYVDLGCGHGVDARWLGEQGATAWGLDHVPEAYQAAAEAHRARRAGRTTCTST